ncbi:MAG TPA: MarR family transcriptional regulator [Vicinamibacterales bacterium]|nr:MarR family transcriptional regulator [Vicinamibacterales bacterium]
MAKKRTAAARSDAASTAWVRSERTKHQVSLYLSMLQAVDDLHRQFTELFKDDDLSWPQYNVLRILRGAGPAGATCGEVGERLIKHDPDVTRLTDRLEKRGLIARGRDTLDRRVVRTRITAAGLALLARLDPLVDEMHDRQLGHLSDAEITALTSAMHRVRGGAASRSTDGH